MRCELTFRWGRTRPTRARSSDMETLSGTRFLEGYTIDTRGSSFRKRHLGQTGYIEDRNVAIEYRWAQGRNDRLPTLAAELVRRQVSVIVVLAVTTSAQAITPAAVANKPPSVLSTVFN